MTISPSLPHAHSDQSPAIKNLFFPVAGWAIDLRSVNNIADKKEGATIFCLTSAMKFQWFDTSLTFSSVSVACRLMYFGRYPWYLSFTETFTRIPCGWVPDRGTGSLVLGP